MTDYLIPPIVRGAIPGPADKTGRGTGTVDSWALGSAPPSESQILRNFIRHVTLKKIKHES